MQPGRDFERYAAIAAIALLVIGCYLILRPFLTAFLWGGIIAISTGGIYFRLLGLVRHRHGLAAGLTGIGLAAVLLVPVAILGLTAADEWPGLSDRVADFFSSGLPAPPSWIREIPLVGTTVADYWQTLAANPQRITEDLRPFLKPIREFLLAFTAGIGSGILELVLALVMATLLYVWGEDLGTVLNQVAERLGGDFGRQQVAVVASTVRGVFNGVIGTAAVQGMLAMIGFWIAGVPGVFVLGVGTFFLSLIPGGPALLWLPAAVWLYMQGNTGWATFLTVWGLVVVGGSDNIIRPLLIGKGVTAPMGLIFLGVIGGMLAFGFLGLFIGPTLLAVAFNLLQNWLSTRTEIGVPAPTAKQGDG